MEVKPYAGSSKSKREQVEEMFDNIAPKYDFLNHSLTAGIDKIWRRKAIKLANEHSPESILDIAAGTGDFSILEAKRTNATITAIDISQNMLNIAIEKARKENLQDRITFMKADSLDMPFSDNSFDSVTVGFGVRNFVDIPKGLSEILRVLKPGGRLVVLELSEPPNPVVKACYSFYFHRVLPFFGRLVSKDKEAYTYLPNSVDNFPYGDRFVDIMKSCGYCNTMLKWLTMGISAIYVGEKPVQQS
ncbi:MAG: bifunctional demethylmenaquinone methyltransferase/2-methoxy-6-polyprenyl-1,4-benzoquinol methylase UbiE [Bacteroidales bacterium]|nr:bifunctional demethylmenaquinone methyltransferase/2-methoxy-6-polyprenyl-1,4-benzoquinol methylase UbiE [Bacteroidales bacterium]